MPYMGDEIILAVGFLVIYAFYPRELCKKMWLSTIYFSFCVADMSITYLAKIADGTIDYLAEVRSLGP